MLGGPIAPYYHPFVDQLVTILKSAKNADDAWKTSCKHFKVKN